MMWNELINVVVIPSQLDFTNFVLRCWNDGQLVIASHWLLFGRYSAGSLQGIKPWLKGSQNPIKQLFNLLGDLALSYTIDLARMNKANYVLTSEMRACSFNIIAEKLIPPEKILLARTRTDSDDDRRLLKLASSYQAITLDGPLEDYFSWTTNMVSRDIDCQSAYCGMKAKFGLVL